MDTYSPATISSTDLEAVAARLDRYLDRHGSRFGENPIPEDCRDDVRQSILADWLADDWTAREWQSLARHGRPLFGPDLSELGRHLRAILFHAGRARVRRWRAEGAKRGEASRRRGLEDFSGVGSGSRSADPALVVAAVESASGQLVLSRKAQRLRAMRGMPLRLRAGIPAVPAKAPRPFRLMKTRNTKGWTLEIVARHEDRTAIQFVPWVRYNFERVGSVPHRVEDNCHYRPTLGIGRVVRSRPNPARASRRKTIPAGIDAATMLEAVRG
jgi:hypothetical protein